MGFGETGLNQIDRAVVWMEKYSIQVYDLIQDKHDGAGGADKLTDVPLSTMNADDEKYAVVEFHAPTIAVRENVGKFPVTIWRHGNLNNKATVR